MNSEYVELGQRPKTTGYTRGFAFVLPIQSQLDVIDQYKSYCPHWIYMTVSETNPVNPCYGLLERYGTIHVPSNFAKSILEIQFPKIQWKLLHHWSPTPVPKTIGPKSPYIFYTIGNVNDPRKNIKMLIECFIRSGFSDAMLVIKATCLEEVKWKIPNIRVINGLLSPEDLDAIHDRCHCYVNCSHSEGVGMGAVEAAMRDKPVIITDYGGLKEYVRTPWVVPCTEGPIGFDDFLFTKDLHWGYPDASVLKEHMADCYQKQVTHWDHSHTREIVSNVSSCLRASS